MLCPAALVEVFSVFLKLGVTSFGGPVAHLGYFRDEFVKRRRWMSEADYADLIALCQFLPGATSSQVGFSLGVLRSGGLWGGCAAWLGFTLPSVVFLLACAFAGTALAGPVTESVGHGLQLVAVAVVAQAVWGMARTLTPDWQRRIIAAAAGIIVIGAGSFFGQIGAILCGACIGYFLCHHDVAIRGHVRFPVSVRQGIVALFLFVVLLMAPPLMGGWRPGIELFSVFYRAGAFVFGGGHVVLPLLRAELVRPGWMTDSTFLTGYGLAQAVPGPLFSFAAYLGAVMETEPNSLVGSVIALVGLFLPGLLLVYGMLPFWDGMRSDARMQAAMRGASAAVVGMLAVAFYNPVCLTGVKNAPDAVLAGAGFLLLAFAKCPSWVVVMGLVLLSVVSKYWGSIV